MQLALSPASARKLPRSVAAGRPTTSAVSGAEAAAAPRPRRRRGRRATPRPRRRGAAGRGPPCARACGTTWGARARYSPPARAGPGLVTPRPAHVGCTSTRDEAAAATERAARAAALRWLGDHRHRACTFRGVRRRHVLQPDQRLAKPVAHDALGGGEHHGLPTAPPANLPGPARLSNVGGSGISAPGSPSSRRKHARSHATILCTSKESRAIARARAVLALSRSENTGEKTTKASRKGGV